MLTQKFKFINPTDLSAPIPNGLSRIAIVPNHQTIIYMARQGDENKNGNAAKPQLSAISRSEEALNPS